MAHQLGDQPAFSTKGIERKVIEKNRRNYMNDLCSKLDSLLSTNNPTGASSSRVDQIDKAINYIKSLETKVKMAQEKKESLMKRKRCRSDYGSSASVAPKIDIQEMGPSLQITLTCGFDAQFIFNEIIRLLNNEENIEVKSLHSSLAGNSMLLVVHAEIQQFQVATTAIGERLKRFVDGH